MPRLTEASLTSITDEVFGQTLDRLRLTGLVMERLLGLDGLLHSMEVAATPPSAPNVSRSPDDGAPEGVPEVTWSPGEAQPWRPAATQAGRASEVVLASPLWSHAERIGRLFTAHQAVAAVLVTELWAQQVPKGEAARIEALVGARALGGDPYRMEMLGVCASWPLRGVMVSRQALIRRFPDGSSDLESLAVSAGSPLDVRVTWIARLLPQPPEEGEGEQADR